MTATSSGAASLANELIISLAQDKSFAIPDIDASTDLFVQPPAKGELYGEVTPITAADLTEGKVGGNGMFDRLMVSLVTHLKVEFEANRISGAEYTKAYIGAVGAALQTAQQFLVTKDQAYWSALLVQQQARAAEIETAKLRVEMERVRVELAKAKFEAANAEANYSLTKIRLATEDAAYASQVAATALTEAQTQQIPAQTAQIIAQTEQAEAQTEHISAQTFHVQEQTTGVSYTNTQILPAQKAQVEAQTGQITAQTAGTTYTNTNILPAQKMQLDRTNDNLQSQGVGIDFTNANILPEQAELLKEQVEVQRAQTLDARSDLVAVKGLIGKQKDLYTQQVTSYQRDAETKLAKIYTDSWITQKTIDEGLIAPTQFTNQEINEVLVALRGNLNLGS